MTSQDLQKCRELAKKVRIHCLEMVCKGKSGHIGSMLSMADILPVIYTQILNVDPADPEKADRDRFILSKVCLTCSFDTQKPPMVVLSFCHRRFSFWCLF